MEQKKDERISDLDRGEELCAKLPTDDIDIGMATLKCMPRDSKKERVSFKCNMDSDYSFSVVKKLIKAAYREVGKPSPCDSDYKRSMHLGLSISPNTSNISIDELLRQVLINASGPLPALL